MQTIGTFDDAALTILDVDVATSATVRSTVCQDARGRTAVSVELHVTGVTGTVNLVLRPLGQNSDPATDTTRLLALNLDVPDLSALTADYHGVFLLPLYTAYMQIEIQNVSGALVHVKVIARGTTATFDDKNAGAVPAAGTSHVVVDTLPGTAQTDLDAIAAATVALANLISSGSLKAILTVGAAVIGKLAANAGVIIGDVNVVALPSLVLAAGAAAIGKLAANAGVNIGAVDVVQQTSFTTVQQTVGTSSVQLQSGSTPVKNPIAKADPGNTGVVYLITSTSGTTATGVALGAGDALPVPIDDLNKIWFIASAASQKVGVVAGL